MAKRVTVKDVKELVNKGYGLEENDELKIVYRTQDMGDFCGSDIIILRKADDTLWGFNYFEADGYPDRVSVFGQATVVPAISFEKGIGKLIKLSDVLRQKA